MDIFFMILFNLFTASVIYLVLSLKIERTSSTFQEKRLRKEMNEIMTEFNAAAERNISILENRIAMIKKMADQNGILKKFDYTVRDEETVDNSRDKRAVTENTEISALNTLKNSVQPVKKISDREDKNDEPGFLSNIIDKISLIKKGVENVVSSEYNSAGNTDVSHYSIEREVARGSVLDLKVDEDIMAGIREEEAEDIGELFRYTDDKYSLINELYGKGYSVEELSRFSGVPAGEVRLIISLNS